MNNCQNCGIEFEGRKDAKFCSPKCRVTFSRKQSIVTDNVTFSDPVVTDNFEFTIVQNNTDPDKYMESKTKKRSAGYWYDVPLGALPVIKKDWPKMPVTMNGRQYFLWWKNEFEIHTDGKPVILNPLPVHDKVRVELGGESARRWGA